MLESAIIEDTLPAELADIPAEQALLGVLLIRNDAFLHIGQLQTHHFYEPLHQRIFTTMQTQWNAGVAFDAVMLKPHFDHDQALADIGGGAYLGKLCASAVVAHRVDDYAKLLIDLAQRRLMMMACDEAKRTIADLSSASPAESAMQLATKLYDVVADASTPLFQDDVEVTESIMQDMKRDVKAYKTGYPMLDIAMDGGLYPGKSYGFAARKKVGKTILAGSVASNLNIAGVRHLFICGEMSPAEVQKRTLCRLLRVKQAVFNSKEGKSSEFMKRIDAVARESSRSMIYRNAPGITFDDLKRYVLLARMQKKITGFILDYWQLVGGKPKGKSTAEHLDEVAQWIADTCRKYDLWSITMAQINQEGNTRGGEGIRLAFDQVYTLQAPNDDAGRSERWLEMSDTRYTAWRSVGSENRPGLYLNEFGPYFSETPAEVED